MLRKFALLILAGAVITISYLSFSRLKNPAAVTTEVPDQIPLVSPSTPTEMPAPTVVPATPTPTAVPTPTRKPTPTPLPTPKPITGPPGAGITTATVSTAKGDFRATIMTFDLGSTRMVTDTGNDSDCATDCTVLALSDYVTRNGGFAGVNGTYFCPASYPECASKKNSYDFPVYNTRLGKWINAGTLSWGGRAIVYTDGSGAHYQQNSAGFGGGLNAGIINYPGLVSDGNVQIDENQSGLSDKQKVKNTKIGIGVRGTNIIMVVAAQNVNMHEFAHVFKSLGATGALNLDTGGSAAMYYNGRYVLGPGRAIPNAVVFVRK